jgi:hypothetical protein
VNPEVTPCGVSYGIIVSPRKKTNLKRCNKHLILIRFIKDIVYLAIIASLVNMQLSLL